MISNKTVTKRSVANALRNGAKRIENYGWVQGKFGNEIDGFCALGSIKWLRDCCTPAQLKAGEYLFKTIGSVPQFNDRVDQTREAVVKAMRKAARELDHGASL